MLIRGHCVNEISKLPIGSWTERPARGRREGKKRNAVCASGRDEREGDRRERRGEKRSSSEHSREL
jgi:hypothetical protein